ATDSLLRAARCGVQHRVRAVALSPAGRHQHTCDRETARVVDEADQAHVQGHRRHAARVQASLFSGGGMSEEINIEWNDTYRLWWPSNENENVYKRMLNRVTDVDKAVKYCKSHGVAVQAGGFIGMWPARLARWFVEVYTFEPIPHLCEC